MISALWLYLALCVEVAIGFFVCAAMTAGKLADEESDRLAASLRADARS